MRSEICVGPEDIAVVTQYHAQVLKIRKLLRQAGMEGITVTSVENIQGQVSGSRSMYVTQCARI